MSILVKSKTSKTDKNRWGTTWECFNDAQFLNGTDFTIDVCAEVQTTKCDVWIAPNEKMFNESKNLGAVQYDALECLTWENNWWCNPPFDLKEAFIKKAIEQAQIGNGGMILLPYERTTRWWRNFINEHATTIYEPDGRYSFYESDGSTKKPGVNFASAFVLFSPARRMGKKPETIEFKRGIGNQIEKKPLLNEAKNMKISE